MGSSVTFDLQKAWDEAFTYERQALRERYPDIPESDWQVAGKPKRALKLDGTATKAAAEKPNGEDIAWWNANGLKFAEAYITWRESSSWEIWVTPEGTPAIELFLSVEFDGQRVQVYIDRLFVNTDTGELIVVDIKSGARMAQDEGLQFGFYASAVEVAYGIRPEWACYYDARKGCITEPRKVDHLTPQLLGAMVREYRRAAEEHKIFLPNLGAHCSTCSVRKGCAAAGGENAATYDSLLRGTLWQSSTTS